jgi:hypothetical protein
MMPFFVHNLNIAQGLSFCKFAICPKAPFPMKTADIQGFR